MDLADVTWKCPGSKKYLLGYFKKSFVLLKDLFCTSLLLRTHHSQRSPELQAPAELVSASPGTNLSITGDK
eukprot:scaffold10435_cov69-Cyclotella_meneghiniana.AAC.2